MDVLLFNLTRFGDLIQTQPVVSGLVAKGFRVHFVCLEPFQAAAKLLQGVEEVIPFNGGLLLADLAKDWQLAVVELEQIKQQVLTSVDIKRIINLTPSIPARVLAQVFGMNILEQKDMIGFCLDECGFNADSSPWAAFLQMAGSYRGSSPFNIVDLFCRCADLREGPYTLQLKPPSNALVQQFQKDLQEQLPQHTIKKGLLGIQLGASKDQRRWPVACFAEVAKTIWEETGRASVLFGTSSEQELAARFLSDNSFGENFPVVDLVGKTRLEELGAALKNVDLLLTNDTGTMHLAAGLGVPVAAIFMATAQPFDTGPYTEQCLCFEPDIDCHPCAFGTTCAHEHACRKIIAPKTVAEAIINMLEHKKPALYEKKTARIWSSRQGKDGFMELYSLSGHEKTDRFLWISLQRHHYRLFFDEKEQSPWTEHLPLSQEFCEELIRTLEKSQHFFVLIKKQFALLNTSSIKSVSQKFMSNMLRIQRIFEENEQLQMLGSLWQFLYLSESDKLDTLLTLIQRFEILISSLLESLRSRHES